MPKLLRCNGWWGLAIAVALAGCEAPHVYDAGTLASARHLAVMPADGSPGDAGANADAMQASALITCFDEMDRWKVEGPGRLRRAMRQQNQSQPWDPDLQAKLVRDLGIDVLAVSEVTDYGFAKQSHSNWWGLSSSFYTDSTYYVGVQVRLLKADTGKLLYDGRGWATSEDSFGPALAEANQQALAELSKFLADRARQSGGRP